MQRAAPALGVLGSVVLGACAWPYTVDDAFIVARYATRLASGYGYTLSGNTPSDGVTGPLWLLPGLVASASGFDPVTAAKALGLACSAVAVALILRRLGRRAGGGAASLVALALFLAQPTLGTWGVAGLETGAATLALCCAALAATARPRARMWQLGAAIAALAWLRPELAFAALVLLSAVSVRHGARAALPAWACACASLACVFAFRFVLFGELLPLAFHAKLGTLGDGLGYALRSLLVMTGGAGLALVVLALAKGRSDDRVLGVMLAAHGLAVVLAGGDWMPGFRLFAPVLPIYVMLAAVGFVRAVRGRGAGAALRYGAVLALAVALLVPLADSITRLPAITAAARSRELHGRELARYLRASSRRVALVDIGFLGLESDRDVVDLGGITDHELAHLPGGHLAKKIPEALLRERGVDTIVLHATSRAAIDAQGRLRSLPGGYPVERRVASSDWVQQRFRVVQVVSYAPAYEYVVLSASP